MTRTILLIAVLVTLPGTVLTACSGFCCLAVCTETTTLHVTDSAGLVVEEFNGTVELDGGTVLNVDCSATSFGGESYDCYSGSLSVHGAHANITVNLSSSVGSYAGAVSPAMSESHMCCSTCDVGDATIGLQ